MRLSDCHNFHDFRRLARKRLPSPIFNYIDGAADDEVTYRRNTEAFERCDLVPNVLRGVKDIDLSVTVMGRSSRCRSTARRPRCSACSTTPASARSRPAASKFGTMFGVSSLGTVSVEELRKAYSTPQCYQFYVHKDRGLNRAMLQRAKQVGIDVMMLTVDSITGGNRERDLRTGFSIPFRLTLAGMLQFAIRPVWGLKLRHPRALPHAQLDEHIDMKGDTLSIGRYFTEMLDPALDWKYVAEMVKEWGGQFCLKGLMSVEDAKRAVDIGCTGIVLSNHGGRQLDGSRSGFDQLAEVVDAVGDKNRRHDGRRRPARHAHPQGAVARAKAVGVGRCYLFPLAAAGQAGVERALTLMKRSSSGHEADGMRLGRAALARKPAVQVVKLS